MRLSRFALLDMLLPRAPDAARVAFLKAQPFAHRGLHGGGLHGAGAPENSRSAFAAAVSAGHGIELDVQLSADGVPMVFHDEGLERLTNALGPIRAQTFATLSTLTIKGSTETIPTLGAVLALVGGRVPILIEIKADGPRVAPICLAVRRALEGYVGQAAVMSFNPLVGHWFKEHAERVVRGLVMSETPSSKRFDRLKNGFVARMALHRAQPDFIAYDITTLANPLPMKLRAHGFPMLTWTVRSAAEEGRALAYADEMIYERP